MCDPCLSLLGSSPLHSRASNSWKSVTLFILHCSVTCKGGVSISNWQKENARNSISRTTANLTSPSASRMLTGGYEVRNSFFKGCIAPKDITHIRQQGEPREKCLVFEGVMDYLSFLTLRMRNCPTMPNLDGQDYVILNSTANVTKALDVLYPYERIHCLLDNDHAGWKATREIEREYSCRVRDFSHEYRGYADLNDYLCGKRQEQDLDLPQQGRQDRPSGQQEQEPTMKKSRGFRM